MLSLGQPRKKTTPAHSLQSFRARNVGPRNLRLRPAETGATQPTK
jgi:hypothetical protein